MRLTRQVAVAAAVCAAQCFAPVNAWAGGYDIPDNGAEPMGRGGTFVAKADSPLALYYNVAGLAQQRGTRILLDANLLIHDMAFTRSGVYPGAVGDAKTPEAGSPYPTIHDSDRIFPLPAFGVTTDFGYFKRWTFGFGVYGPPSIGKHDYGVSSGTDTAKTKLADGTVVPAPSRYDISHTDLLIVFPTLGVGVQVTRWLDLGIAAQLAWAHLDLANANTTNLGPINCPGSKQSTGAGIDVPQCDAYGNIQTSGFGWGALLSAMIHPTKYLDIGINYRPQIDVHTEGHIKAVAPPALTQEIPDAPVTFNTMQPHILRAGIRYVNRYPDESQRFDVEVDGVYERWSQQTDRWGRPYDYDHYGSDADKYKPDLIYSPDFTLGAGGELKADLNHSYRDTYSIRVGGQYDYRLSDVSRLMPRIGFYFDSAATHYANTRLDFNTMAKYAFTLGLGYKWKGLTVNVAYAYIYSPSRTVTNSETMAIDSNFGSNLPMGRTPIYVGNGTYDPMLHVVSVGLTVNIPELKAKK